MLVDLISHVHSLVRRKALEVPQGSKLIIHTRGICQQFDASLAPFALLEGDDGSLVGGSP
jgi:hypothetical protein